MSVSIDRPTGSVPSARSFDPIARWLVMVAALVMVMVVVGGFVRLSRAGLSIVEWDVVTGVVPPIGEAAWEESFADYRQTPEYLLVNRGMTLGEYQHIFYIEWAHRLIARAVGLLVVLPLLWFLWKGVLSVRASLRYWGVAALFGIQGVIGWAMVSSGLRDRPAVSHYRLTIHLIAALLLLGIVLWMALDRLAPRQFDDRSNRHSRSRMSEPLAWVLLSAVVVQIAYGGLVAGLRAGYVSNTWPLMFGRIVPEGLLTVRDPWWVNLVEPLGAHWVHRWFAFLVAGLAAALVVAVRRDQAGSRGLRVACSSLLVILGAQIAMGIGVVVWGVPKWLALAHQGLGVVLFSVVLVITHRVRRGSGRLTSSEYEMIDTTIDHETA